VNENMGEMLKDFEGWMEEKEKGYILTLREDFNARTEGGGGIELEEEEDGGRGKKKKSEEYGNK